MTGNAHIRKHFLAVSLLPLCIFLITLGMRVPSLAELQSGPKPRPRAVIEKPAKSTSAVTAKKAVPAAEPSGKAPVVAPQKTFEVFYSQQAHPFNSLTLPTRGARAPPLSFC